MSAARYPGTVNWRAFALFLEAKRVHRGVGVAALARAAGVGEAVANAATHRTRWIASRDFEALCRWMGEAPELFGHATPRRFPQPSPLASSRRRRDDGQRGAGGSCPVGRPAPAASIPPAMAGGPGTDHRPPGA